MKTRTGFVSNSSTCSFVVLGTRITEKKAKEIMGYDRDDDEWYEKWAETREKRGICIKEDEKGKNTIFGVEIASISSEDYGLDESKTPIDALVAKAKAAMKQFGIEGELTVFTGTEGC